MLASRSNLDIQILIPAVVLLLSTLACSETVGGSEASAAEEAPPVIQLSNAPAAPPESAEARIALRQHREASALNRFTFPGNVLEGTGDHVDSWIVMFCPIWHEKCQGLLPSYELLGVQWENKLNLEVMSSRVRFAKVDCATSKGLCVSLDIDDYPAVVHYSKGQRVASWHSGAPGLVRFIKQQLEPPKQRPKAKRAISRQTEAQGQAAPQDAEAPPQNQAESSPEDQAAPQGEAGQTKKATSCDAAGSLVDRKVEPDQSYWLALRPVCFALMLLAASGSVWMLYTKASSSNSARLAKSTSGSAAPQGMRQRSSLQACLPQDWACDRQTIVL